MASPLISPKLISKSLSLAPRQLPCRTNSPKKIYPYSDKVLGVDIRAAMAKGRRRYVCHARLLMKTNKSIFSASKIINKNYAPGSKTPPGMVIAINWICILPTPSGRRSAPIAPDAAVNCVLFIRNALFINPGKNGSKPIL